jgi:hypothetical protein
MVYIVLIIVCVIALLIIIIYEIIRAYKWKIKVLESEKELKDQVIDWYKQRGKYLISQMKDCPNCKYKYH